LSFGAVTDESTNKDLQAKDVVVTNGQAAKYIDQAKAILENNKGKPFLQRYCAIKERKFKLQNNDGMLGVKLAGLSFASMEKLGYYKVSQQNLVS
jgi:regulator of sigma E protease